MYNILVPVDFSSTSIDALHYALDVFKSQPLKVTVLHAYKSYSGAFHIKDMNRVLGQEAEKQMDALIRKIEKKNPEVLFKPVISRGDAVDIITSLGDSGEYDVIVMGTKGASGLKEVIIGSVAGEAMSHTSAPVLVVPTDFKFTNVESLVLALGNMPADEDLVVTPLLKLKKILDCKVDIVHIAVDGEENLDKVFASVSDLGQVTTIGSSERTVNEQLEDYIESVNGGILALVRTDMNMLERLLKGSVTMRQTFRSKVPLLVLHS